MVSKCRIHPVLVVAVALWVITAAIAAVDWHGLSLRRIFGLGALSTAVMVVGLALNSKRLTSVGTRTVTRFVGRAIVRAPKQAWWNGYGTGADDTLKSMEDTLPRITLREDTTQDLAGRGSR